MMTVTLHRHPRSETTMDFCTNDLFEVTNNVAKRQIVATQDIRACDMHCILQGIGADDSSSSLSDV